MSNNFKIGDKVKLNFEYINEHYYLFEKNKFTKWLVRNKNKIFIIKEIIWGGCVIEGWQFNSNELEPAYDIKTKINFVKEIIKK